MKSRILRGVVFIQALVATLGSLYFSNFGDPLQGLFSGPGFDPCDLCRWSRTLMYPMVGMAAFALWKKEDSLALLTGVTALAGILLSTYHYIIQHQNSLNLFSCGAGNDCTLIGWHIGFVTIPFLALVAYCVIATASGIILYKAKALK